MGCESHFEYSMNVNYQAIQKCEIQILIFYKKFDILDVHYNWNFF